MYKIDKIKKLLDCGICSQLMVEPVTLPCGKTVCKCHLDIFVDYSSYETFECALCHKQHSVPEDGFKINECLQNALDTELNTISGGQLFVECTEYIELITQTINKIQLLKDDPGQHIYEYFEDCKRKVDMRRETLKAEIDQYSEGLIKFVDEKKAKCMLTERNTDQITISVNDLTTCVNSNKRKLDILEIGSAKFEIVKEELVDLKMKSDMILIKEKNSLLNDDIFSFKFENPLPISVMFGNYKNLSDMKKVKIFII